VNHPGGENAIILTLCWPCIGHARKALSVESNVRSNCLPNDAVQHVDDSSSSIGSDAKDSDTEFTYDPQLLEDKEHGYHVAQW